MTQPTHSAPAGRIRQPLCPECRAPTDADGELCRDCRVVAAQIKAFNAARRVGATLQDDACMAADNA